jgi:hypothetical protein
MLARGGITPAREIGGQSRRYVVLTQGRPSGSLVADAGEEGAITIAYEYNDRGRGPKLQVRLLLDERGIPRSLTTEGVDYLKAAVMERYTHDADGDTWSSNAEKGEIRGVGGGTAAGAGAGTGTGAGSDPRRHAAALPRAYYVAANATPFETGLLARALSRAPGSALRLLPAGEARLESIGQARVQATAKPAAAAPAAAAPPPAPAARGSRRRSRRYLCPRGGAGIAAHRGDPGRDPRPRLRAHARLARSGRIPVRVHRRALHGGARGIRKHGPVLWKAQQEAETRDARDLARRLRQVPSGPVVLRHASVFDPATGRMNPGWTVVVRGSRIVAGGPRGLHLRTFGPGVRVVDATGKFVLPGLWDMHVHQSDGDGLLQLACGITTARDLGNDIDHATKMRADDRSGAAIGPRLILAGVIDGPGPRAAPTKVLAATPEEARRWVDTYAAKGYEQIKIYSSVAPSLVPSIIAAAKDAPPACQRTHPHRHARLGGGRGGLRRDPARQLPAAELRAEGADTAGRDDSRCWRTSRRASICAVPRSARCSIGSSRTTR